MLRKQRINSLDHGPPELKAENMPCSSLYIHVPFCERKCNYCAFESAVPRGGDFDLWLEMLGLEFGLRCAGERPRLDTCYIGGGTPTVLPPRIWESLADLIERHFDFAGGAEITVEANPNSLRAEHLLIWRDWRVTRVSVGVQSFDGAELEMMGRLHNERQAHDALSAALAQGFRVSADFIFGLPFQTLENWARTLKTAVRCGLHHISLYQLSIEEGTPWETMDTKTLGDGYWHYRWAQWYLPFRGYGQYEISNFAKPGMESLHNMNYWDDGEYIGVGPGAASYICGRREKNFGALDVWAGKLKAGRLPVCESETLDPDKRWREAAVLALRTSAGIDKKAFTERFGTKSYISARNILEDFPSELREIDERGVRLTKRGMRVANIIWSELI